MAKYYPQSQITTNLYTNGGEYQTFNKKEYIGPFYLTSDGKRYVGKTYNSDTQIEITPISTPEENISLNRNQISFISNWESEPDQNQIFLSSDQIEINETYNNIKFRGKTPPPNFLPTPGVSVSSDDELSTGQLRKYYAKKANQFIYMEINKETYNKLKDKNSDMDTNLYECLTMIFLTEFLPGNKERNKLLATRIEKDNGWAGFVNFLGLGEIGNVSPQPTPSSVSNVNNNRTILPPSRRSSRGGGY